MITQQQQIQNIRKLIKVAEKFRDSKAKLDMGSWFNSHDDKAPSRRAVLEGACNTTLCLAGRAGLEPYFRRQGLTTDFATCYVAAKPYVGEVFSHAFNPDGLAEMFGFTWMQQKAVFHGGNELTRTGRISKTRTLNRIIHDLKQIGHQNFNVQL